MQMEIHTPLHDLQFEMELDDIKNTASLEAAFANIKLTCHQYINDLGSLDIVDDLVMVREGATIDLGNGNRLIYSFSV